MIVMILTDHKDHKDLCSIVLFTHHSFIDPKAEKTGNIDPLRPTVLLRVSRHEELYRRCVESKDLQVFISAQMAESAYSA